MPAATPAPEPSSCSCDLSKGEWGDSGWHYRHLTADAFISGHLRHAERRAGGVLPDWRKRQLLDEAQEIAKHYTGQPVAFEPCRSYRAGMERRASLKKKDEAIGQASRRSAQRSVVE